MFLRKKDLDLVDVEELINIYDKALSMLAQEVGEAIQEGFNYSISTFYSAYHPDWYDRTESMFSFSSGYSNSAGWEPLYKRKGKLKYEAGITVGPENVKGNPYEKNPKHGLDVNAEWVFDVSYMKGIHGFNRQNIFAKMNKLSKELSKDLHRDHPKEYVENFRSNWAPRSEMWRPGIKSRTSSSTYNIWEHVPYNTTPPDKKMRREYKKVLSTVNGRLDVIMSSLL